MRSGLAQRYDRAGVCSCMSSSSVSFLVDRQVLGLPGVPYGWLCALSVSSVQRLSGELGVYRLLRKDLTIPFFILSILDFQ